METLELIPITPTPSPEKPPLDEVDLGANGICVTETSNVCKSLSLISLSECNNSANEQQLVVVTQQNCGLVDSFHEEIIADEDIRLRIPLQPNAPLNGLARIALDYSIAASHESTFDSSDDTSHNFLNKSGCSDDSIAFTEVESKDVLIRCDTESVSHENGPKIGANTNCSSDSLPKDVNNSGKPDNGKTLSDNGEPVQLFESIVEDTHGTSETNSLEHTPTKGMKSENTDAKTVNGLPSKLISSIQQSLSRPMKCRKTGHRHIPVQSVGITSPQKDVLKLESNGVVSAALDAATNDAVVEPSVQGSSAIGEIKTSETIEIAGKENVPGVQESAHVHSLVLTSSAETQSPLGGSGRRAPKARKSCHPADERSPSKPAVPPPAAAAAPAPAAAAPTPAAASPMQSAAGFGTVLLTELGKDLGIEGQSIDKLDGRTIDQMILAKLREHLRPRNGCITPNKRDGMNSPSCRSPASPNLSSGVGYKHAKFDNHKNKAGEGTVQRETFEGRSPLSRSLGKLGNDSPCRSPHLRSNMSPNSVAMKSPTRIMSNRLSAGSTVSDGCNNSALSDTGSPLIPEGIKKRRKLKTSNWARGSLPKGGILKKKELCNSVQVSSKIGSISQKDQVAGPQRSPRIRRTRSICETIDETPQGEQSATFQGRSEVSPNVSKRRKLSTSPSATLPIASTCRKSNELPKDESLLPKSDENTYPVTPPATPIESDSSDASKFRSLDSRRDISALCHCKLPAWPSLGSDQIPACQAVDSIDGKISLCLAKITQHVWVRPSSVVPFKVVCEYHHRLLKRHQCCPVCGHFCTQGTFLQCRPLKSSSTVHYFHEGCQVFRNGKNYCPHCDGEAALHEVSVRPTETRPSASISIDAALSQFSSEMPNAAAPRARINGKRKSHRVRVTDSASESVASTTSLSTQSTDRCPAVFDRRELELAISALEKEKMKKIRVCGRSLISACKVGDIDKILYLLSEGVSADHQSDDSLLCTPLHVAAKSGHYQVVLILLQAGAEPNVRDSELRTPLMEAVEQGHLSVMEILLKAGSVADQKSRDGMTLLHVAAKAGQTAAIRLLLENRRLDVNAKDEGGWTPLVWAAEHCYLDTVKYLLSKGADPDVRDNENNTGLHWAAYAGSAQIAEIFLDAGCGVDNPNEHGDRPLHIAARQDHKECIDLFLIRGANIDVLNSANETPIMCCAEPDGEIALALKITKRIQPCRQRRERLVHRDISRGREQTPITAVNSVDDCPFPSDFLYVVDYVETMPISVNRVITSVKSCQCKDNCSFVHCDCAKQSVKCWYDQDGRLTSDFNYADPPLLFECNRACQCFLPCTNRVVQLGIVCRLQVFKTVGRGWGVRALHDIQCGTFICEYAGELITDAEADKREDDSYLFDLDNQESDTFCIDAARYGNVSRFINHLCEPNLVPVKVFVDHQDLRFPRMCFFAARDIRAYEELGFDYGSKFWIIKYKQFTCTCGSSKCRYSAETIMSTIEEYNRRQQEDCESNVDS